MSENVPNRPAAKSGGSRRPTTPANTRNQAQPRSMKDYLIMLRERWYWGLLAALLVGGTLYFVQIGKPKVYTAITSIILENPVQPIADMKTGGSFGDAEINLDTQIARMKSGVFLATLVATFTPKEVELIRADYLDPKLPPDEGPGAAEIITGAIDITKRKDTNILDISATHRNPLAAELLANSFAKQFIDYNLNSVVGDNNRNLQILQQKENQLRQQLEEAQAKEQEFVVEHKEISVMGDSQNLIAKRLERISSDLLSARASLGDLVTTLDQVETYQKTGKLIELNYIAQFGSIPTILRELDLLKSDRALLEQRYGENHPKMIVNTQSIAAKNAALQDNVERAIAEIRSSVTKAKSREQDLLAKQAEAEKSVIDLQKTANAYEILKSEKEKFAALYSNVARQKSEMELRVTMSNLNIRVMDKAEMPWEPSDPNPRKILVWSCIFGSFFFIGVPIILGVIDVRLKAAWEVEQFLNQNLIGEVPSITGVARKERAHIMAKELDHTASEAFRGLFGHLQLNSSVPYPKVLMITSTLPGEGKSMIANNLAATFASHGKKTLLVDCDFRRPNLHLYYGKDNACGVLRWLNAWNGAITGPLEEDQDLGILPVKQNLFLLRAGGEHRRATELFETDQFAKLIATLRQQFEVVIIDTPPLGVFPDAMLVSRKCDEALYVCRFNTVNRSKIRKSLDRLKKSEAVLAGVVLNGLPTGKQSAYYDYYGYGSNENKRYKAYYAQKR